MKRPDEKLYIELSEEIRKLEKIKAGLQAEIKAFYANGGDLKNLVVSCRTTSRVSNDLLVQAGLNPNDFMVTTTYEVISSKK